MCHIHATILPTEDWLGLASAPQTSLPLPKWPEVATLTRAVDSTARHTSFYSLVPSSKRSLVL